MSETLLEAAHLSKTYGGTGGLLRPRGAGKAAVDDVSLSVRRGESLGVVGESGCGKSTLARMLTRLVEPTSGSIAFEGRDVLALRGKELRDFRRHIQLVFQDPYSSLNPRKTVGEIVAGPLRTQSLGRAQIDGLVGHLLTEVGLAPPESYRHRYPKDLSGGQRQRVGIARAMALYPDVVVADEPVSALDVSVRAQILNLFNELRAARSLTYVFISHDLAVIRSVCDRVIVMHEGRVVEEGPTEDVLDNPQHPYTQALVGSSLVPDPSQYPRAS